MKILYFSITSKLNTDSNLIFRRVLLSKLDRNRAGYMTDWLMVNGISMYFFLRIQARVVDQVIMSWPRYWTGFFV